MQILNKFKTHINNKFLLTVAIFLILAFPIVTILFKRFHKINYQVLNRNRNQNPITTSPTPQINAELPKNETFSPTPALTYSPTATPRPLKIIFGIGSQAGPSMDYRIVKEAPVHMLSSWYNGTKDLVWMREQQNDLIPRLFKNHYIVHLITWTDLPEIEIQTPHGSACGRPYPVSDQLVEDMRQLAQIYNGPGPIYVSLFTEFQTYTCIDNNWTGNENYWLTLKDNYRKILKIFHSESPTAKVSLSWGGWQGAYDDKVNQGGRSLFPYFADVIKESDFASFQAMESDSNVEEIRNMTRILGSYGKQVMLAHYKPSNSSNTVFVSDLNTIFTDKILGELINNGLFAMSFMDSEIIDDSDNAYQTAKNLIINYGK
jgi:hypothetical protein